MILLSLYLQPTEQFVWEFRNQLAALKLSNNTFNIWALRCFRQFARQYSYNENESFQDPLKYIAKFGRPNFFITFKCHPKWKVISELLLEGQAPNYREDVIEREFHQKIKIFSQILKKKQMFGKVKAELKLTEFQKRGLPHTHMLLWLE